MQMLLQLGSCHSSSLDDMRTTTRGDTGRVLQSAEGVRGEDRSTTGTTLLRMLGKRFCMRTMKSEKWHCLEGVEQIVRSRRTAAPRESKSLGELPTGEEVLQMMLGGTSEGSLPWLDL